MLDFPLPFNPVIALNRGSNPLISVLWAYDLNPSITIDFTYIFLCLIEFQYIINFIFSKHENWRSKWVVAQLSGLRLLCLAQRNVVWSKFSDYVLSRSNGWGGLLALLHFFLSVRHHKLHSVQFNEIFVKLKKDNKHRFIIILCHQAFVELLYSPSQHHSEVH